MEEKRDLDARMEKIEKKLRELSAEAEDDAALGLLEEAVQEIERMEAEMEGGAGRSGEAAGEEGEL